MEPCNQAAAHSPEDLRRMYWGLMQTRVTEWIHTPSNPCILSVEVDVSSARNIAALNL